MDSLTVYLIHVKELLKQKKYQRLWNECSQFYEFGTTSNVVDICLGPEFSSQSLTQSGYVNHLMNKHYYLPQKYLSDSQLQEFSQALEKADQYDQRNVGSIIGMILLAIIGFVGFGFQFFGIIVGAILGALIGRFLGRLIKRTINSRELLELDVFELRILCLLRWAHGKSEKYKYNLNLLRFVAEKILLESKIVLHYKQYSNVTSRNRLKQLLLKIGLELNQFQQAIKLSLLFAKEELIILQKFSSSTNNNVTHFNEHRNELEICFIKSIDNVLKPMMSIMREMKQEQSMLYLEIRKFLLQQEILQVSRQYPDPQMSVVYIKMIAEKMKQRIQTKYLKDYIKIQNFRDIENLGIYIHNYKTAEIECEQQISIQEQPQQIAVPLLVDEQLSLQLQIQKHPNRVFFQRLHQKQDSHETPIQSLQEIYQILEPEFPQGVQLPNHYSEQSKQKFELFLNYFNEPTEDWELAVKSEDTVIYKTMKEGSESVFIRGYGIIKNSTLENVVDAVYNVDRRRGWDQLLQGFEVVKKEYEDTDVVYYYVVPPVRFVTQREWLQRRILRRDYPKKGQICLLFYSVELKEFKVHKDRIRANTEISSMVFEEVQNGIRVSILSNNDIKGYIPKMIVNRASASGPVGWFGSLQKVCKK